MTVRMYCWRCRNDVPMFDEAEWASLFEMASKEAGPVLTELSVKGYFETMELRRAYIWSLAAVISAKAAFASGTPWSGGCGLEAHRAATYGPPCHRCGKPLRTPQARFCGICSAPRHQEQELMGEPVGLTSTKDSAANGFKTRLNTALTFDSLVEGTANRMARAAAMHVSGMPGHLYNPLFIYGGVGLGKTHLVHAVGNRLLADKPGSKVLYIHAEQFVSDVVKAYQRKTFDEFKQRYHSLDLLLIDDVQFFANKERTQEEFFNAFEALLARKSHIVMTSDTYPKGLADIHERLVSRFDSGLTVAIEPPELEMRVAILISKARSEGTEMPEEVAFFVAKNVRSDVRELEGALRKILAYSRFNQKEISI